MVDDKQEMVGLLKIRLESSGYEVISALDGESCLKKATEKKPSLIILDILLPDINGFEVCRRLKRNDKTKNIPIIMLTALSTDRDLSKGLEEGADCFITKPFNPADLLSEIGIAIDKRSKVRSA